MTQKKVVAIDGPAGAGKSTVAKLVADKLNYLYIDTGAMYRAITLKALNRGIPLSDTETIVEMAKDTNICLSFDAEGNQKVLMDGIDVTNEIRSHNISQNVSEVASIPGVRIELVRLQREMASCQSTVMDGRDIGSYVLPDADYKVFLTATPETRALRRQKDLLAQGYEVDIKQLEKDIIERDRKDSQREMAPLVRVPDAELIETSNMSIDEVVDFIISRVQQDKE